MRRAAMLLMHLCEGIAASEADVLPGILRTLRNLVWLHDSEVLVHACWALANLMESSHLTVGVDADMWHRVVALLSHGASRVQPPALRAVGNLLYSGNCRIAN